jgi:thioredoxin reductase (NADPH)
VRDALSTSLRTRVGWLEATVTSAARPPLVVGPRYDPASHTLRDFLERNFVETEWLDPTDEDERWQLPATAVGQQALPLLILPDDTVLSRPSLRAVAEAVGLSTTPAQTEYDVAIVGSGPSGLAAAVYGASEGLRTLLLERTALGGQAGTSSRIENYLGFPTGVSGSDLTSRAFAQATRFGAEIVVTRRVEVIEPGQEVHTLCLEGGIAIRARAVILALGVAYRRLKVPGIDPLVGAGVYYGAARTEAIATRGGDIYLIGGGNSAGQAAMFFADYAARVTLLVRGPSLGTSISQYLIEELATRENIAVHTNAELIGVIGQRHLEAIVVRDRASAVEDTVSADAVFIFIGADAHTDWLPEAIVRDRQGYVLTGRDADEATVGLSPGRSRFILETSVPGVFAAGDVRHGSMKRVAAAVGEGSMAIAVVHQYLAAPAVMHRI